MEDIPPSYYQSMNPSVLDLVAPYLDTPALHSMASVSRSYNEIFMPHLWGSPASHFVPVAYPSSPGLAQVLKGQTLYDDVVYVALTRFKKTLRIARESTRQLTHTLYLPTANSEIYSGPNATWLREILDGLPNLQSLCVSGLPFFDHHSLVAVKKHRPSQPTHGHQTYPVKLLLASKESNTTSIGLSLFLPHLSNLVYLDLSYTIPARDINVLSSLEVLVDLQVLKLRGIGLRDMEAEALANAIGLRVRLLDLAENALGDMAVRSLLQACFMHHTGDAFRGQNNGDARPLQSDYHSRRHLESWPVGLPPAPDFLSLDTLRSADLDRNLLVQLTNPLTGRLAFEDIPHGGLTHLYITGNPAVTIEGIKSLLEVGRLHVLDAGDIAGETAVDKYVRSVRDSGKYHGRTRSMGSGAASVATSRLSGGRADNDSEERMFTDDEIHLPGAEKLIPVLREKASKTLTYLRIEHSIVTKDFDLVKERESRVNGKAELPSSKPTAELSGDLNCAVFEAQGSNYQAAEMPGSNHQAVELPSHLDVYELDPTPVIRAELPGDLIHFAISPPIGDKPEDPNARELIASPTRGDGAFAPEVVQDDGVDTTPTLADLDEDKRPISPISIPLPISSPRMVNSSISSIMNNQEEASRRRTSTQFDHQLHLQKLLETRPKLPTPSLHPSSLPNLRTLTLTNIPAQVTSTSSPILTAIKTFITACAAEAFIAILRAQINYSLPPGRARAAAERKHAQSLFALRTIVLEVSPVLQDTGQRDWKSTRQRLNMSKSSTGDHDSEALWSAAENDFSFFGEEGEEHEECGIYDHEPGKYFPSVHLDDKFSVTTANDDISSTSALTPPSISGFSLQTSTATMFRSPRELPLGRNRQSSDEVRNREPKSSPNRSIFAPEMPGSVPPPRSTQPPPQPQPPPPARAPTSHPHSDSIDLVADLSKWRKARKTAYEDEVIRRHSRATSTGPSSRLADSEVFVEGHWPGEIKVVRNSKPVGSGMGLKRGQGRLERTGMVDVYGNYFEKGYLYS